MKTQLLSFLKFLIGWPFSILALFFILRIITPRTDELLSQIQHLNPILLVYGVISFLAFYIIRSYIWYFLIRDSAHSLKLRESSYLWAISEVRRYIPGNIWSFLGRTVLFSEKGISKKDIGKSLVYEAGIFVIGSTIVSALSWPFLQKYFSNIIPGNLEGILLLLLLVFISFYIFNARLIHFFPASIRSFLHIVLPKNKPIEIFFLIFLSIVALAFYGLGTFLTISSFIFLHPQTIIELIGFFVLSLLLGYLSVLTPAGFGVREGFLIAGLSKLISFTGAAFSSLFSRIILILSELIFILLASIWYRTKNASVRNLESFIASHKHEAILGLIFLVYVIYFVTVSFLRYDNYYTGRFDLGNMAQTVWNTMHGRIFMFTNPNGTDVISRLAFHADFLLILLAPFYAIWPNPKMLLLIQTLFVGAGSFFVFLIAKDVIKNKNLALTFAAIFLFNPSIQRANIYDFHAVTFATTFLLGAYYFYLKKNYKSFIIFAILAGICKEQIWLIIALFGVLVFIRQRKYIFGSLIFLISLGLCYYLISHAIPNTLGSEHFALEYYSEFGDGPVQIIKTIVLSPQKILNTVIEHDRMDYLKQLFLPLGYLSLLVPIYLIFAVPDLTINLLSNNEQLHQIYYQYTATVTPFIFIAAIHGAGILKKIFSEHTPARNIDMTIAIYLLATTIYTAFLYGPLPGAREPNTDMFTKPVMNREFIDDYLSKIPRDKSVAASNNLGSHLSERQFIYTLPLGTDRADVIAFLLTNSEPPQSLKAQRNLVSELKNNSKYKLIIEKGDFIVFEKN